MVDSSQQKNVKLKIYKISGEGRGSPVDWDLFQLLKGRSETRRKKNFPTNSRGSGQGGWLLVLYIIGLVHWEKKRLSYQLGQSRIKLGVGDGRILKLVGYQFSSVLTIT